MPAKLKKYYTGYRPIVEDAPFVLPPFVGRGWRIEFEDSPLPNRPYKGPDQKEIVIHARTLESAQNALELIRCGVILYTGDRPTVEIESVIPEDLDERSYLFPEDPDVISNRMTCSFSGLSVACKIASKASHKRKYQYALSKLRLATLLYSHHFIDLDPENHAYQHVGVFNNFHYHVCIAHSIILSYSVIEEINLQVKASQIKPSMIRGKWNPEVRTDLEERLRKANVPLEKGIYWIVRGKDTRIHKNKPVERKRDPSWKGDLYIRDGYIDYCDAINRAGYLRSQVSSHKTTGLIKSLTGIDAENVRYLSRKLLLCKMKMIDCCC